MASIPNGKLKPSVRSHTGGRGVGHERRSPGTLGRFDLGHIRSPFACCKVSSVWLHFSLPRSTFSGIHRCPECGRSNLRKFKPGRHALGWDDPHNVRAYSLCLDKGWINGACYAPRSWWQCRALKKNVANIPMTSVTTIAGSGTAAFVTAFESPPDAWPK